MFNKKNKETARKVKVQHDGQGEVEVKINVRPLVTIEKHEHRINGKVQAPEFRISIGGRDVLMVNSREYRELTREILRHIDADSLIHEIATIHAEEHARAEMGGHDIEELLNGLGSALEQALGKE